ncbi:MAG: hypothetical protein AB1595_01910 [bacterium]
MGYTRRRLKEIGWLGKRNTLEGFIDALSTIKLGKFHIREKEIFRVQKENPIKGLLKEAFDISSFEWTRDRKLCSI